MNDLNVDEIENNHTNASKQQNLKESATLCDVNKNEKIDVFIKKQQIVNKVKSKSNAHEKFTVFDDKLIRINLMQSDLDAVEKLQQLNEQEKNEKNYFSNVLLLSQEQNGKIK